MFGYIGKHLSDWWWVFLGVWLAIFVGLRAAAPPFNDLAQGGEFNFLPANMASRQGEALLNRAFPGRQTTSNIVIVVHRDEANELTDDDRSFIEDKLEPALAAIRDPSGATPKSPEATATVVDSSETNSEAVSNGIIAGIHSFSDRGIGELLTSHNRKSSLIEIELSTDFQDPRNWPIVEHISEVIRDAEQNKETPTGLKFGLTGSATLGRDLSSAEADSAKNIGWLTVTMVIVLLLVIYRAPILALVPLITLFISVDVSLHALALLAHHGYVTLFRGLEEYITVIAYGPGIDYCLFLIARYKENLQECIPPKAAVGSALSQVGSAIAASGATVICGIGMLTFAEFGKFHEAGIGISIALMITLIATLTLTPSLLRLAGRWAFWPKAGFKCDPTQAPTVPGEQASPADQGAASEDAAVQSDLFQPMWIAMGEFISHHPFRVLVLTLLGMMPLAALGVAKYASVNYGLLESLPASAPSAAGTRVLERDFPAGITGPISVLLQSSNVDFRDEDDGMTLIENLVGQLMNRREQLKIADIRSVSNPLGMSAGADPEAQDESEFAKIVERKQIQRRSVEHYVSSAPSLDGHVTQLDVILSTNPFSIESVNVLDDLKTAIQTALPAAAQSKTAITFVGPTASVRDVTLISHSDQRRIYVLVVACVFMILVLLLRSFTISLYLLLTVLLSFVATLGATWLAFYLLDPKDFSGLDWTVPLFLFVVLIAVGEDYNIFLVTRIQEEQAAHGPVGGIKVALARTGGIITSCGFIMAGTFASLCFGSLTRMQQLGFALAFGVLLDTFVVRPILVPAFLVLLNDARFKSASRYLR